MDVVLWSLRAPGRRWVRALPTAFLCLLTLGCAAEPEAELQLDDGFRPNVVIVLIDALRADRLGVAGYPLPTTPSLDALAAEGIYFSTALSHSTWTKPSIATLITSLYPSQHGIQLASVGEGASLRTETLDESLVTLAERLREGGYATGAVINQVHLQARFGFGQGYDHYDDKRGRDAFRLNARLQAWLETLEGGPFFAYVHYLDLHWPFTLSLPENEGVFGPTAMKSEPPSGGREAPEWGSRLDDEEDLRALQARYDHEVAYTDAAVGDLVDRLRELGLYEDTLILVTSDHGEAFLEHGQLGHAFAPHEELIRVPLVLRQPARLSDFTGSVDRPVGLIDVFPTLLEIAGLAPEAGAQGESFAPLLRGEEMTDRVLFSDTYDAFSARSRTHKLIWFEDGRREFYDLSGDPLEQRSQAEPCDGPCREMAQLLRPFRRLMLESRESNPAGTADLNPDDIETLRSLGYVD